MNTTCFDPVKQCVQKRLQETGIASLAMSIAQNGNILYETGWGWADRANRRQADAHTMYSLASISKPITATALMILVERGLIDLDKPINDYLGHVKLKAHIADAGNATVRRVANHSSGLPLHCHFFYEDEGVNRPHINETLLRYGRLMTPPGETYQYANSGYGFLEYLIERVSGKSYADFLTQEVFIPLNMPHASVDLPAHFSPHAAVRYAPNGQPLPGYTFDHPGASAVWASAHDLVRFGMFHIKAHMIDQRAILSDAAIDAMQKPTVSVSETSGYGVGWRIVENDFGYRTVGHDGSMGGVRTRLLMVPDENIAITVLTNAGRHDLPIEIATEILSVMLPDYAKNRKQHKPIPVSPAEWTAVPELLGQWTGIVHTYRDELPVILTAQPDGDLHLKLGDQFTTLVNNPAFKNDLLTGRFHADLRDSDAGKHPYHLALHLKLRNGNTLNGPIHAITTPHNRSGNALSFWTELKKS